MASANQVTKMEIRAFKDAQYKADDLIGIFKVQVNPDSYNKTYQYSDDEVAVPGGGEAYRKHFKSGADSWEFSILLDGTGAIADAEQIDVNEKISELKKIVMSNDKRGQNRPYLKIAWGEMDEIFSGTLDSLTIEYKLFKPDGTPIRAIAKLSLKGWEDVKKQVKKKRKPAPETPQVCVPPPGCGITQVSEQQTGSPDNYMSVARANDMDGFREMNEGQSMVIPGNN